MTGGAWITALHRALVRHRRSERGIVTAEFLIGIVIVFTMFMVTIELSFLMARSTLLHQSLEVTMREVRLGLIINPTVQSLEGAICDRMSTIPDCASSLVLEFTQVDQTTFEMPAPQEPCTRRSAEIIANRGGELYFTGEENELMVVRACMVVDTITPFVDDAFELFARTAFVNEPRE